MAAASRGRPPRSRGYRGAGSRGSGGRGSGGRGSAGRRNGRGGSRTTTAFRSTGLAGGRSRSRSRGRNRRELRRFYWATFILGLPIAIWVTVAGAWIAIPVYLVWTTVCLGFLLPVVCNAYRTDDGLCEALVRGWLPGCPHHSHAKWRDLRTMFDPRNAVSPLHTAGRALHLPVTDDPRDPLLDGAPDWVTTRGFWTMVAITVSLAVLLISLLVLATL